MPETSIKKIMWGNLREHKVRSLVTLLFVLLSIVLQVLPPLVLARAVDALTASHAVALSLAVGYFALLACSGLSDAVREALIVGTGEGITHGLRSAMMRKLHRLPSSYFTEHEAGQTVSIQVNDVDAIEDLFSSGVVSMITDLGTVISILVTIFTRSIGLGLLLVVILPLLFLFTRHVQKKMLLAHTENRKATAGANGILPETMKKIRSLHVYHAERFAEERYDKVIRHSFQALERTNFYDSVYSPVILTVSAIVIGVMMSLSGQSGAFREWFGMSVGTAVALIAYVNNIFTPLSSIGMEIQTIQSAAAGWKRAQGFLDEEEEHGLGRFAQGNVPVPDEPVSGVPGDDNFAIEIDDVTFSYDAEHLVLDHFSLDVEQGEFVTLTGRTGAGKSTLFKLLLGLYSPESGSIILEGLSPADIPEDERRRRICCVEQKVIPVVGSVGDQVTLGNNNFTKEEIWRALELVGLKETVSSLPEQLDTPYQSSVFSHGQNQLLMIARAIVSNPDILLLDEITAGLDSTTEKMVVEALEKASENRTVLSISHRMSQVMHGRIVELK